MPEEIIIIEDDLIKQGVGFNTDPYGSAPIPIFSNPFYSVTETSIGLFKIENNSTNLRLKYTLSNNDGCGSNSIIASGFIDRKAAIPASATPPFITISNLPDGFYTLNLTPEGQINNPVIKIKNFPRLEKSILQDVKELFGGCTNCKNPADICCLLNKMNYYNFINEYPIDEELANLYKCAMVSKIDCSINSEFYSGKCGNDTKFMISYLYFVMFNNRTLANKIEVYDYKRIYKYISTNIIRLY